MATTLYFKTTTAGSGPTGELSPDTDSFTGSPSDKNTSLDMTSTVGSGQTSVAGAYSSSSTPLYSMMRMFVSPALAAQTLTGSQTYYVRLGGQESNVQMNLYWRVFVYVWRSGSGNVKTIGGPTSCAAEHGASEIECVLTITGAAGDFSILENDRIVVELWADIRNTKATSYTATLYYDGTDTTFVDGTATTDAGSHFYSPQTLNFAGAGGAKVPWHLFFSWQAQ